MKKEGIIELRDLMFHAFHGCLPQERIVGADYVVNLRCTVDLRRAAATDDLKHTVNYATLYDIVKSEMGTPVNLLEKVAGNILKNVRYYAPAVKHATVTICKLNPPFEYAVNALETEHTAACVTLSY
ncbi:MAG: dihydroneopterin aldolase [Bacteroidales bacterium]|nr:dihydroneopterin aldolase [Bacteroidales bacterium]